MMIEEKKPQHERIDLPASFAAKAKNYFILRNKRPVAVDMWEWARWFETADRTIAKTQVGSMLVSTVFLGCNHQFGKGPPLIFETMVFADAQSGNDRYCWRYSSYEDAEIGHAAAVRKVKAGEIK